MSGDVIRVLIADDHQMVRQGLEAFLRTVNGLEPVGQAANGVEAIELCDQLHPDVVLMDMVMPRMGGVEATGLIRKKHPEIQVIALTSFTDDKELVQIALKAGAIGYLFKDISVDDLAHAIRKANQGEPILAPGATRLLIQATTQPVPQTFNLTDRELEVLAQMVKGLSNRQIAEQLTISRSTVKFHVSSILGKLGADSRTQAVSIAHEHNLVT